VVWSQWLLKFRFSNGVRAEEDERYLSRFFGFFILIFCFRVNAVLSMYMEVGVGIISSEQIAVIGNIKIFSFP